MSVTSGGTRWWVHGARTEGSHDPRLTWGRATVVSVPTTVPCTHLTPCLAGPQPQGSGPSPGPLLVIFIHTVECKIDGPLNYRLQNFAVLQIFEVKFANI